MTDNDASRISNLAQRLNQHVLDPLKARFVGKDHIIDLMGVCLVGGEHLFLFGPPGTAKSALVHELGRRIEGRVFDYLLTRFTEPNELFGPFDIRRLREGELVTNTEGMLPEASLVFLDELLNANSAILNSLLQTLNERVFRRGRESRLLPMLMAVGASNHLPEDDALRALFDRFLVRVRCDNVGDDQLASVLNAGWRLEQRSHESQPAMPVQEIRELQQAVRSVRLEPAQPAYLELVKRLRHAGIAVSDRRAVKFQRLIAASSLLCGRLEAQVSDLWVLRNTWDTEEQTEVIRTLVQQLLDQFASQSPGPHHPQARDESKPDPETLARHLHSLHEEIAADHLQSPADRQAFRDRLAILSSRCQWVTDEFPRKQLLEQVAQLWEQLEGAP